MPTGLAVPTVARAGVSSFSLFVAVSTVSLDHCSLCFASKIGFRDVCPHCGVDLHTCTQCRYYTPGKPNACLVPGTEYIRTREASNFCEEFKMNENGGPKSMGNNSFNSLFKDDV